MLLLPSYVKVLWLGGLKRLNATQLCSALVRILPVLSSFGALGLTSQTVNPAAEINSTAVVFNSRAPFGRFHTKAENKL